MKVKAQRIHAPGGPEVLRFEDVEIGAPGPGQALVRHTAIGVNFIDCYHRSGLYPVPLPAIVGSEGAGRVEAVGPGVTELAAGDRVAYAGVMGAYAEARLIDAAKLVKLPDAIDDKTAAAAMLKGMTAEYLLRRTYPVRTGDTILFHAAAGGVGSIACQWAKRLGATVIGTVGSDAKVALAREAGCDHVLVTSRDDVAARVRELTGGAGVRAVYDGVGKDTFAASLDSLAVRGVLVSFGQSSGSIPAFDLMTLSKKGGLYLTRPTLNHYTATRAELVESASALFDAIRSGVRVDAQQTWPLSDAAEAHRALEARRTTGASLLLP